MLVDMHTQALEREGNTEQWKVVRAEHWNAEEERTKACEQDDNVKQLYRSIAQLRQELTEFLDKHGLKKLRAVYP